MCYLALDKKDQEFMVDGNLWSGLSLFFAVVHFICWPRNFKDSLKIVEQIYQI